MQQNNGCPPAVCFVVNDSLIRNYRAHELASNRHDVAQRHARRQITFDPPQRRPVDAVLGRRATKVYDKRELIPQL
jgi:hypothetical protein